MSFVLVVREFDAFSQIVSEAGFSIINCPAIEVAASEDLTDFDERIAALESYDGVFLTSSHAAKIFRGKLRERNISYNGKVYVLGRRGFNVLKDERLDLRFDDAANTAREMLEKIAREDLKDKNFLFVRGETSLRVVPDFLREIARIDEAIVYRTVRIAIEVDKINKLREKIENRRIACACFFSPSAADSFSEQFGAEILHQINIAAIGKTTAEFFEKRDVKVDFVSPKATAEDFAVGLTNYLRLKKYD